MGHRGRFAGAMVVAIALLAGACGGDSGDDAAPATTGTTTAPAPGDGSDSASPAATAEDADDGANEGEGTASAPEQSGGGDLSLVPQGETDILGNPAGQGFVELDGVRYDFILNRACQKIFGAVQAGGSPADGSDATVNSIIPPEDWETDAEAQWDPPAVEIDIGDDSWRAQAGSEHIAGGETVTLTPEQSSVTSFTNDGSRVAGDAIFYSAFNFDEVETASGSFEFYCP